MKHIDTAQSSTTIVELESVNVLMALIYQAGRLVKRPWDRFLGKPVDENGNLQAHTGLLRIYWSKSNSTVSGFDALRRRFSKWVGDRSFNRRFPFNLRKEDKEPFFLRAYLDQDPMPNKIGLLTVGPVMAWSLKVWGPFDQITTRRYLNHLYTPPPRDPDRFMQNQSLPRRIYSAIMSRLAPKKNIWIMLMNIITDEADYLPPVMIGDQQIKQDGQTGPIPAVMASSGREYAVCNFSTIIQPFNQAGVDKIRNGLTFDDIKSALPAALWETLSTFFTAQLGQFAGLFDLVQDHTSAFLGRVLVVLAILWVLLTFYFSLPDLFPAQEPWCWTSIRFFPSYMGKTFTAAIVGTILLYSLPVIALFGGRRNRRRMGSFFTPGFGYRPTISVLNQEAVLRMPRPRITDDRNRLKKKPGAYIDVQPARETIKKAFASVWSVFIALLALFLQILILI